MTDDGLAADARVRRRHLGVLVAVFCASRAVAYALGLSLEVVDTGAWKLLDPDMLTANLSRSLWNLHMQPPGFNLMVGVLHKLPLGARTVIAPLLFSGLGLASVCCVYIAARDLGASSWAALAGGLAYALGTESLLYESFLSACYPVAAAMMVSLTCALRYAKGGPAWLGVVAAAGLTVASLTHALFHPAFLLAAFAVLVVLTRGRQRRAVMTACTLGLLLVLGLFVKNYARFDTFSASSWLGLNLATTTHFFDHPGRQRLVAEGKLGELSSRIPFARLHDYGDLVELPDETHPPELYATHAASGRPNFNHTAYVGLSKRYLGEWRRALTHAPSRYATSVLHSAHATLFVPSSDFFRVRRARKKLAAYADAQDLLALRLATPRRGEAPSAGLPKIWYRLSRAPLLLPLGILLALLCATRGALRFRSDPEGSASEIALRNWHRLALLTLAWVLFVPNILNRGEGNRLRVMIGPLLVCLVAVAVDRIVERVRAAKP